MSRKNQPKIVRLGINYIHNYINQNYGKNYNIYFQNLSYQFSIYLFLVYYLKKYSYIYHNIQIFILKKEICIKIICIKNLNNVNIIKNLFNIFNKSYLQSFKIFIIYKDFFKTTTLLLDSYINFLILKKFTYKKKLIILLYILNKIINTSKIINTKRGPIKIKLIGYKIKFKGRFENTKNQMAHQIFFRVGKVSLITLNNYIDFTTKKIDTKLGVYSLSIWLYYIIL